MTGNRESRIGNRQKRKDAPARKAAPRREPKRFPIPDSRFPQRPAPPHPPTHPHQTPTPNRRGQ